MQAPLAPALPRDLPGGYVLARAAGPGELESVLAMLWLGSRSMTELEEWYPDASVKDATAQRVVDALFPKRESWVCSLF